MSRTGHDARFMALALSLGRRGLGRVAPWPSVGCVIVRDGRIVGRGTSDRETMRHAEVVALDQAGESARGATVYVTLEPCCHHGNTPPCADALIAAGVARAVIAMTDPNPRVNSGGVARMAAVGIKVEVGLGADEAARDHAGFFSVVGRGRPHLTLKLAASLDGRIATASGESRWITGPQARAVVHGLRASHDAVLIGGGTARADDPELTVRGRGGGSQPVRVVATRHLDIPPDGRLFAAAARAPVWLLHGPDADLSRIAGTGARPLEVAAGADGQLSPAGLLKVLADEGITRVLCEGGGALSASLLGAGLVDEMVVFHAGMALGAEGIPSVGALGVGALAEAPRFELAFASRVADDVMSVWRPTG